MCLGGVEDDGCLGECLLVSMRVGSKNNRGGDSLAIIINFLI